jgi:hypothetical protein
MDQVSYFGIMAAVAFVASASFAFLRKPYPVGQENYAIAHQSVFSAHDSPRELLEEQHSNFK